MDNENFDFIADMMAPLGQAPTPAPAAEPAPAPAATATATAQAPAASGADAIAALDKPVEEAKPEEEKKPEGDGVTYAQMLKDYQFTEREIAAIDATAENFNVMDNNQILQYGVGCQKQLTDFADAALSSVKTKDMGVVGDMLADCVKELKSFDASGKEEKKGIMGLFKKGGNQVSDLRTRYNTAEKNVNTIVENLEGHQVVLMKDVSVLDQMYEKNKAYFRQLSLYIAAGKKKLEVMRNEEIPALMAKAQETGRQEDAQAVKDLDSQCNRFEKRLYDLELTRMISLQMAPQIRMIQSNDTQMIEKIQSTIINTVPLWKNQMVLALGMEHSVQAAKAQAAATELTNDLLMKNAEILHTSSVETAKASEKGIVDMETLRKTNESLITTLDEVMTIQKEGHKKRMEAESEMQQIEADLRKKLLELSHK